MSRRIVVLSPPGRIRPATSSRSLRQAHLDRLDADRRAASATCSANAPWRARTPIFMRLGMHRVRVSPSSSAPRAVARLPAADREPLALAGWPPARCRASARPGPCETSAMIFGSSKWVVAWTMAFGRPGRVLALEDARADEHALGAQLHRQRRVGRRGDAAGHEVDDRQPARRRATSRTSSYGAWSSLAATNSSSSRMACRRRMLGGHGRGCGGPPRRCCRCRPRPWCGSSPRPR